MPIVATPAATPCPTCQTNTPRPACPTCLPHMDPIERTERTRMATQAREAIALNESRGLPIPKQWRAWATVDEGLHPPDTS